MGEWKSESGGGRCRCVCVCISGGGDSEERERGTRRWGEVDAHVKEWGLLRRRSMER